MHTAGSAHPANWSPKSLPVVADAAGFHLTIQRQHPNADGTCNRYSSGSHTK